MAFRLASRLQVPIKKDTHCSIARGEQSHADTKARLPTYWAIETALIGHKTRFVLVVNS